jgi:hypothetical protein
MSWSAFPDQEYSLLTINLFWSFGPFSNYSFLSTALLTGMRWLQHRGTQGFGMQCASYIHRETASRPGLTMNLVCDRASLHLESASVPSSPARPSFMMPANVNSIRFANAQPGIDVFTYMINLFRLKTFRAVFLSYLPKLLDKFQPQNMRYKFIWTLLTIILKYFNATQGHCYYIS